MADVIRPYVGEKVSEIGAGQVISRCSWFRDGFSDINPLYLTYLENLGVNRPYMRVGYTDGEKGDSFRRDRKFDTVFGAGCPACTSWKSPQELFYHFIPP